MMKLGPLRRVVANKMWISTTVIATAIVALCGGLPSCTGGAERCGDCRLNGGSGDQGGQMDTGSAGVGGAGNAGGSGDIAGNGGTSDTGGMGVAGTGGGSGGAAGMGGMGNVGGMNAGGSGGAGNTAGHGGAGAGGMGGSASMTDGGAGIAGGGAAGTGTAGSSAGGGGRAGSGDASGVGGMSGADGGAAGSGGMGGMSLPAPFAYYPFEGNLNDTSGNGHNGTATGTVAYQTGQVGMDLSLNGNTSSGPWVNLPANLVQSLNQITIAFWVRVRTDRVWARVFDFGSNTNVYMHFSPHALNVNVPRFAITTSSNSGEQLLDAAAAIPVGTWTHVAIVIGTGGGTLYINGVQSSTNANMTLRPSSLGATSNDWLGHSQWSADPYLDGEIDEFRIYSVALTAAQVRAVWMLQ